MEDEQNKFSQPFDAFCDRSNRSLFSKRFSHGSQNLRGQDFRKAMSGRVANGGIAVTITTTTGQNLMSDTQRRPAGRRSRSEQRNRRHTQPGGEMQRPGVAGNENFRPRQHREKQRQLGDLGQNHGLRREVFQFRHQRSFAFAPCGGKDNRATVRRGEPMKFRPICQRPLFFLLTRSDVANHRLFTREDFFCRIRQ